MRKGRAHQQLFDKVLRVRGKAEWKLVLEVDDLLEHEVLCPRLERRPASEHLKEDAAERPKVGAEARLAPLAQDLGADVFGRADERARARAPHRVCESVTTDSISRILAQGLEPDPVNHAHRREDARRPSPPSSAAWRSQSR